MAGRCAFASVGVELNSEFGGLAVQQAVIDGELDGAAALPSKKAA